MFAAESLEEPHTGRGTGGGSDDGEGGAGGSGRNGLPQGAGNPPQMAHAGPRQPVGSEGAPLPDAAGAGGGPEGGGWPGGGVGGGLRAASRVPRAPNPGEGAAGPARR